MSIDDKVKKARELGFSSYGKYVASMYDPTKPVPPAPSTTQYPNAKKSRRKRGYTDEQLFLLWQEGKTDLEIAQAVGVSRQCIQCWRDRLELPSTSKFVVNTQKYRLKTLRDGTYIVVQNDEF